MARGGRMRLIPNGFCWCGCKAEAALGKFFLPGHDKFAEAAVIQMTHGSIPEFLVANGFGPDGKNLRETFQQWRLEKQSATQEH